MDAWMDGSAMERWIDQSNVGEWMDKQIGDTPTHTVQWAAALQQLGLGALLKGV